VRAKGIVIAIDGPSGAGKSTVAQRTAERLGYLYVDSGAMYRVVALVAREQGIPADAVGLLVACAAELDIDLKNTAHGLRTLIDERDVTEAIRAPEISQMASLVATIPGVREHLVAQQQRLGQEGGVVMEGRDIATVVFPDAELKVFLDASPEVRARRRYEQQQALGLQTSLAETAEEVRQRDLRDRERAASPLQRAPDAVYLDTTALTADEVVEVIVRLARGPAPEQAHAPQESRG